MRLDDILAVAHEGDLYCVDCTENNISPKQFRTLMEKGLDDYTVVLAQENENMHGCYCGNCHETLCPDKIDGQCDSCNEAATRIPKNIIAVRELHYDVLAHEHVIKDPQTGEPLYDWLCRTCALERYQVNSFQETLITNFQIATDPFTKDPNVIGNLHVQQPPLGAIESPAPRFLPLYQYTPIQKDDQRLHGRECTECLNPLCSIDKCPCFWLEEDIEEDQQRLQAMRYADFQHVYAKLTVPGKETHQYMIFVGHFDAEHNLLREYAPLGYAHKIWVAPKNKDLPSDLVEELAHLQKALGV